MCATVRRLVEEKEEQNQCNSFGNSKSFESPMPAPVIDDSRGDWYSEINTGLEKNPKQRNTCGTLMDKVEIGNSGTRETFKRTLANSRAPSKELYP
jgi:hypothetical protein